MSINVKSGSSRTFTTIFSSHIDTFMGTSTIIIQTLINIYINRKNKVLNTISILFTYQNICKSQPNSSHSNNYTCMSQLNSYNSDHKLQIYTHQCLKIQFNTYVIAFIRIVKIIPIAVYCAEVNSLRKKMLGRELA